ncbi:MAG: phosphotransferase [Patescibacteria group bacterium]
MKTQLPEEITTLLKKHHYQVEQVLRVPDRGLIRSYVIVIGRQTGKKESLDHFRVTPDKNKYILKYFWQGSGESRKRFLRAIKFLLARERFPNNIKSHILPVIRYSFGDGGAKDTRPWMVTRHYAGKPLSNFMVDLGVTKGQFTISAFENFANFITSFLNTSSKELDLGFYDMHHAQAEIASYKKNNREILTEIEWQKLEDFVFCNNKVFNNLCISHRDLYPENLLFRDSDKVCQLGTHFKLIDWEYVSKVPVGWDPAFFGLLFWREKIWTDRIYALFYSRYKGRELDFNLSYRFCTAVLALRFLYQMTAFVPNYNKLPNADRIKFVEFLKERILSAISGSLLCPDEVKFMISGKIISRILNHYNIGEFKGYEVYHLSKGNTVFKLRTTMGSFVIRIYNSSRSLVFVKKELRLFSKLKSQGIPTYGVVNNLHNKPLSAITLYGKKRRVVVLTYIRGGSPTRHEVLPNVLQEAGATLKKIHALKVSHGDFSKRNVLFYKGKVSGVIDLEYGREKVSAKNLRKDLAKSVALWCMSVTLSKINISERVEFFLKGYWESSFTTNKVKRFVPQILKALDHEEKLHHQIYGEYGGESFKIIRQELIDICQRTF